MEQRRLDYVQCDAAPVNAPGGGNILKQAIFNKAIAGWKPFLLAGLEMAVVLVPSSPRGILSGPWRTALSLQYSAGRNTYPFLGVAATNPNLWMGRITLHDILGGDATTFVATGSIRFRFPIEIRYPDSGLTANYRPGTEWGQSDVQLVVIKEY
jgi:hypothetical protein